jgi:hypothetical protein
LLNKIFLKSKTVNLLIQNKVIELKLVLMIINTRYKIWKSVFNIFKISLKSSSNIKFIDILIHLLIVNKKIVFFNLSWKYLRSWVFVCWLARAIICHFFIQTLHILVLKNAHSRLDWICLIVCWYVRLDWEFVHVIDDRRAHMLFYSKLTAAVMIFYFVINFIWQIIKILFLSQNFIFLNLRKRFIQQRAILILNIRFWWLNYILIFIQRVI